MPFFFTVATHIDNFSDGIDTRISFVGGDYPKEHTIAKDTKFVYSSLRYPESLDQFLVLEAYLLFDANYTSVAVKGSDASDLATQVFALHSGVRLCCDASTFLRALPAVAVRLKQWTLGRVFDTRVCPRAADINPTFDGASRFTGLRTVYWSTTTSPAPSVVVPIFGWIWESHIAYAPGRVRVYLLVAGGGR